MISKFFKDSLYLRFSFPFQVWSLALRFQGGKLRQAIVVWISVLAAVPGVTDKLGSIKGSIWKQDEMRKLCSVFGQASKNENEKVILVSALQPTGEARDRTQGLPAKVLDSSWQLASSLLISRLLHFYIAVWIESLKPPRED